MGILRAWARRVLAIVQRRRAERELDEELRFHLAMEEQKLVGEGSTPEQARKSARVAFGGVERWREEVRDARRPPLLFDTGRDIRHGLRIVRRRPAFASAVVLTLALGIGASTSIFSVVDGVLFRPLPYAQPERLLLVWETYPSWRGRPVLDAYWDRIALAWPDYVELRDRQRVFRRVAVFAEAPVTMAAGGEALRLDGVASSASLLDVLGVRPALGRFFLPGEEGGGASRVAVVSHGLWVARFGRDSAIVGRSVQLEGLPFEIVGVLPRGFRLASADSDPDIWTPIGALDQSLTGGNHSFRGIARLRDSVPFEEAAAETARLLRRGRAPEALGVRLVPLHESVVAAARPQLLLLLAAAGVLLAIACMNAAMLLLTESSERRHEAATRASLGAAPSRLVRQFLVESIVLSAFASALGAAFAVAGTRLLLSLAPADLPRLDEVAVDGRVLSFVIGLALLTGAGCGLVPGLSLARTRALAVLRGGSRQTGGGGGRRHTLLLTAELAVVTVLLTSAALLGRSLLHVGSVDPGFRSGRLLTAMIELPERDYPTVASVASFHDGLLPLLRAIPGVESASGVTVAPFSGARSSSSVGIEGLPEGTAKPEAEARTILPDYFETMGIPLLAGRTLGTDPLQMLVSERMARDLWPGQSAVGQRASLRDRWYTVVGIVDDVRDGGARAEIDPTFYVSHHGSRDPASRMQLVLRTAGEPALLAPAVRRVVAEWSPSVPVTEIITMDALERRMLASERFRTILVTAFAVLALTLAAAGVFGLAAQLVRRRWRELGVRLALGAAPHRLLLGVLGRTASAALIGFAIGGAVSAALAPLVSRFLFGVSALDPSSYLVAAALLMVTSLAAGLAPARRAAMLDPASVLRQD